MGEQNAHVSNLFEDSWFFGNSLLNTSKASPKMLRCNSDPCSSLTTKENTSISHLNTNNLLRTPSLPLKFGNDDDDEEPRMGDLIREAMPIMPIRRLDRTPSLPSCRGKQGSNVALNVENGEGVGRLSGRECLESSVLLQEKGPIGMIKLTRRASIDSSMLPPKYNASKGPKQSMRNSKYKPHRKMEPPSTNNSTAKTETKQKNLDKSKSQKSVSDLEIKELQGFKDLGFSFEHKDLNPSVTQLLPALERTTSLDSNHNIKNGKVRRPYLSESWQKPSAPSVSKWGDQKTSSSEDIKAQIKFWARAVASNVR